MSNLPQSPDAERAILSCVLQWADCLDAVASHPYAADLFYSPAHREIYRAISGLALTKATVDLVTVTSALRDSGNLEKVGGLQMLSELLSDVPSPKMLYGYLKLAESAYKRRMVARNGHSLAADACDMSKDVDSVIQAGDTVFQNLLKTSSPAKVRDWQEVLGKTIAQIEVGRLNGGKIPGLSTGFESIDTATNGYQPGQLWVVAARPGAGKTALLLNLVENLVKAGHPTAIFSAEMYAEELAIRSLSGQTRIDSLRLAKGELYRNDYSLITTAIEKSYAWPLWIDDRADMRLIDIQVGARQLVKDRGIKVLFVDYLQLIKEPDGSRNREDAVRKLSDGMKQLAKELGITVIALAQLNRASEKRDGSKPKMSDLRDSGSIEQDANLVLLLHPLDPDSTDPVVSVEIIIAKCRGGKLGPIAFSFDKPTTTFYEQSQ